MMHDPIHKFEYIFLDLDGPILDGKQRHYNCYADIVRLYGGTPLDIDVYWNHKRSKVNRRTILEITDFKGTYNDFYSLWMDRIEKTEYLQYDILKPDIRNALSKLKQFCTKLLLVTIRNNAANLEKQLEEVDILTYFDDLIVCGSKSAEPKYTALKNVPFASALMIGDTEEDTVTAKKLGIKCIAILSGLREKQWLDADCYVDELADIDTKTLTNLLT